MNVFLMLLFMTDGYKLDHRRQYPNGTGYVYSNLTARNGRDPRYKGVINFGLQYFLQKFLMEEAAIFFAMDRGVVAAQYQEFLDSYLGPNDIGIDHILALHDLGYIPLEFKALQEGVFVPYGVPLMTIENTLPEFFWLVNYFETLLSATVWQMMTSATTAHEYHKILSGWAEKTGGAPEAVAFQAHDFSLRGMAGIEAGAVSGMGHLLSFTGTDSIPSIRYLQHYYDATGFVAGTVPATEHSVMCAGGEEDELETFRRLLKLYPTSILSVVSDTWDFWNVIDVILPQLKDEIMARDGKLVIRPDSGDPVLIICGDVNADINSSEFKGAIERLYEIFGGTKNAQGYIELDPHIGLIYGDSITLDRAEQISWLLESKGFASTNVVFGVGSYTYQFNTRDVHGFAMKATSVIINGVEHAIFKKPKTDNGGKFSARGRVAVFNNGSGYYLVDGFTKEDLPENELQLVWRDGKFINRTNLEDIRKRIQE